MALLTLKKQIEHITGLLLDIAPTTDTPTCLKCGSYNIEMHHPYGRNHVPEVVVPLCRPCHRGRWGVHAAMTQAKIDLQYAADRNERDKRALRAVKVFLWCLDEPSEVSGNRLEIQ